MESTEALLDTSFFSCSQEVTVPVHCDFDQNHIIVENRFLVSFACGLMVVGSCPGILRPISHLV